MNLMKGVKMAEYIDREAFIAQKRELYCKDCERRKGMKNGKYRILYDVGDVPCRACGIEDVLSDVEDFPAADVVSKSAYDQVAWERHLAEVQLKSIGKSIGEKWMMLCLWYMGSG